MLGSWCLCMLFLSIRVSGDSTRVVWFRGFPPSIPPNSSEPKIFHVRNNLEVS